MAFTPESRLTTREEVMAEIRDLLGKRRELGAIIDFHPTGAVLPRIGVEAIDTRMPILFKKLKSFDTKE